MVRTLLTYQRQSGDRPRATNTMKWIGLGDLNEKCKVAIRVRSRHIRDRDRKDQLQHVICAIGKVDARLCLVARELRLRKLYPHKQTNKIKTRTFTRQAFTLAHRSIAVRAFSSSPPHANDHKAGTLVHSTHTRHNCYLLRIRTSLTSFRTRRAAKSDRMYILVIMCRLKGDQEATERTQFEGLGGRKREEGRDREGDADAESKAGRQARNRWRSCCFPRRFSRAATVCVPCTRTLAMNERWCDSFSTEMATTVQSLAFMWGTLFRVCERLGQCMRPPFGKRRIDVGRVMDRCSLRGMMVSCFTFASIWCTFLQKECMIKMRVGFARSGLSVMINYLLQLCFRSPCFGHEPLVPTLTW